jgi:ribose 5-phosphate isomerase B
VRIAFATDERTGVTEGLVAGLRAGGHVVAVLADGQEWPEVGQAVGEAVASGSADLGVVCCTTGTGVSIAANKVPGARAALCTDSATAAGARRFNDANVLALGLRLTSEAVAHEVVGVFVTTAFDPSEAAAVGRVEPRG